MPSAGVASFALRVVRLGDRLALLRGERHLRGLLGAVAHIGQFDLGARLERGDAKAEVARILDILAVELGDDVA